MAPSRIYRAALSQMPRQTADVEGWQRSPLLPGVRVSVGSAGAGPGVGGGPVNAQRRRLRWGILASRITSALSGKREADDARFAKLHELAPLLSNRTDGPS